MRLHNVPAALLATLFTIGQTGCDADAPTTGAVGPGLSLSQGVSARRPLSGTCQTSFAPLTLPPPPVIRQVDRGTCQLPHLGRAAVYIVQDIELASGTQRSVEVTFTAANGDVLRAASSGTSNPNGTGVTFQATMIFTGGTGRFASASGEARIDGAASFLTNTASFTLDGWIAYDRSSTR